MPMAPMTASRMIVDGSASSSSVSRLMTRSTRRPCSAAISASGRPMPKATSDGQRRGRAAARAPAVTIRVSRSRPSASVPSQWRPDGPASRCAEVLVVDRVGPPQRRGERREDDQQQPAGAEDAARPAEEARQAAAASRRRRRLGRRPRRPRAGAARSCGTHLRVERRDHQVEQQVGDDDDDGGDDDDAMRAGKSWAPIAAWLAWPRPGSAKRFSMITEPPNSAMNWMPSTETTGTLAKRRACT